MSTQTLALVAPLVCGAAVIVGLYGFASRGLVGHGVRDVGTILVLWLSLAATNLFYFGVGSSFEEGVLMARWALVVLAPLAALALGVLAVGSWLLEGESLPAGWRRLDAAAAERASQRATSAEDSLVAEEA